MNKQFQYILAGSLAALLCATGGALILVWQTMEESRVLEQRNQELQASLEVSRIRVENFCEYPQEALCRVDERTGTVAGAMYAGIPDSPEVVNTVPATPVMPEIPVPSSNANETVEKAAPVEDKSAKKTIADDSTASFEQVKAPAPKPEAVAEPAQPVKLPDAPKEVGEAKLEIPSAVPASEAAKQVEALPKDETPAAKPAPKEKQSSDDILPASYLHEVSGKLSLPPAPKAEAEQKETPKTIAPADSNVIKETVKPAAEKKIQANQEKPVSKSVVTKKHSVSAKKSASKSAAPASEVRKSWSRVENDGGIFAFTITGSGPSLTTSGALLASPLRYELVLDGLWEVKPHSGIENRLVQNMSVAHKDKNTVVTFHLRSKPYRCSLHRPDARTASVRIR